MAVQEMGPGIWGAPSPDGRYLAILGKVVNGNVWIIKGFWPAGWSATVHSSTGKRHADRDLRLLANNCST
jgi:hypothetical protein